MDRRQFIIGVGVAAATSMSGCIDTTEGESNPDTTTESPERDTATITTHSFTKVSPKETPVDPTAVLNTAEKSVVVRGTITVPDSCTTIALGSPPEVISGDQVRVKTMIGTKDTGGDMCTQALRELGYELTFSYEGSDIQTVEISEAGVNSEVHTVSVKKAD